MRDNVIEIELENMRTYLAEYREMWKRYEEAEEGGEDSCPWQEMIDRIVADLDIPAEGYY